jgi:hypothetical protein
MTRLLVQNGLQSDWMHDTARCFGYLSDSSWAALQAGSGHGPRASACTIVLVSTTPADATSATAPGPVRQGAVLLAPERPVPGGPGRPVRPGPLTYHPSLCQASGNTSQWSWADCWAARWRAGSPAGIAPVALVGCAVGRCPGWHGLGWIASSAICWGPGAGGRTL